MKYKYLDYYTELFNNYTEYLRENIEYDMKIAKKSPPEFNEKTKFPTVVMKEVININDEIATNRYELVDLVGYQVDIYTKDFVDKSGQHYSIEVQKELELLTYQFFLDRHFVRTAHDNWENNNLIYDRLTLVFQGHLQSWNKQII